MSVAFDPKHKEKEKCTYRNIPVPPAYTIHIYKLIRHSRFCGFNHERAATANIESNETGAFT